MSTQLSMTCQRMDISAFQSMMEGMSASDTINFGGGSLHPDLLPTQEIQSILMDVATRAQPHLFQYGKARGSDEMIEAQQQYLKDFRALSSSENELLIVNGGTQGIDLACQALLDPGDIVLVEKPTFLIIYSIVNKLGARCISVDVDSEGIDITDLEEKAARFHPKMLYCIPTFQNPSGITISASRREQIYKAASRFGFIILEDDPYYDLSFCDCTIPTIKSLDTQGSVVLLGSFSKIIAPGLRVGFAFGDPSIINAMLALKQSSDMHTSYVNQHVCAEMIRRGQLRTHIQQISKQLFTRSRQMQRALKNYFPHGTTWSSAQGGIFLWVRIPEDIQMPESQIIHAGNRTISYMPGDYFFSDDQKPRCFMRLNYASAAEDEMDIAIQLLGAALSRKGTM